MIGNKELDKTLFKHIVKKVKSEKSELLKSVNREITRKRDSWCKQPNVYILYRIQSDRLYSEYWNANVIQELRFSPTADILVMKILAKDHKSLSMEQFEKIANDQLSEINQVLLKIDSIQISDEVSLEDYFDSLKHNPNNNLESYLLQIGDVLQNYRLSIFDIDSKIAVIALIYWMDIHFFDFEDKNKRFDVESLLEQIKLIVLKSAKDWSTTFVENIKSIFYLEIDEFTNISKNAIQQMREIDTLIDNIISLKKAGAAIETATQY